MSTRRHAGICLILALALAASEPATPLTAGEPASFLVYYASEAPVEAFDGYDLLVLDAISHPPLPPLARPDRLLLGYLSLGEVASGSAHFSAVRDDGLLLQESPVWTGSFFLDVRDRRWTNRVVGSLIPGILNQGFDGLFFDTLDNPVYLESVDPARFRGMQAAAVRLVRAIRRRYPDIPIMINRAYELLPKIERHVDFVLGESVRTDCDFDSGRCNLVNEELYRRQVALLQAAQQRRPVLRVFTLDYWDPDDKEGIASIYAQQRENGFIPYVSTVLLDRIVPEPRR